MKRLIVSIVLVAMALLFAGGIAATLIKLKKKPKVKKPEPVVVRVVAPEIEVLRDYQVEVVGYGSAQPRVRMEITPQVSGEVIFRSPSFYSGRTVKGPKDPRGQADVLFRIDAEDFKLRVDNARQGVELLQARLASLEQEEVNYKANEKIEARLHKLDKDQLERTRQLAKRGATSQNEIDLSEAAMLSSLSRLQATRNQLLMIPSRRAVLKAELKNAKVALKQAELNLADTTHTSPVTGRVISCDVELGERVQAGQVCGQIYGLQIMDIPISLPASDLRWINRKSLEDSQHNGKPAKIAAKVIWTEAGTDRTQQWTGYVDRVEGGLEAITRTARLVVSVDNLQVKGMNEILDRNMYCRVEVAGRVVPAAILIPRSAIQADGSVYLAKAGRLVKRQVKVTRYTDGQAMIVPGDGLEAGDRVITSYVAKPVMGMKLDVVGMAKPAEPTSQPSGEASEKK